MPPTLADTALSFPTQAERALAQFHNSPRTVSLATIARNMGAEKRREWDATIYTFEDDTSLRVTGRGKAHKVEALLP